MSRRNRILLGVLLVLSAAALAVQRPWRGGAHARTEAAVGPLFPALEYRTDEIRRVHLRGEGSETHLAWKEGRWMVEEKDYPADPRRLARLTDSLSALRTRDVVSENPAKHDTYGVAPGQGRRVTLYDADDGVLADWIAGKMRGQDVTRGQPAVLEFYMRRADRPQVYLSGEAILPATDPVSWCDTRFLARNAEEDVQWVEREDFVDGESWRIERLPPERATEDDGWILTEPTRRPAMDYAGDSLVFTLIGMEAADVIGRAPGDGSADARYGFPQDRFRVGIGSDAFVFELGGPAAEGERHLRVRGLPWIYTLDEFTVGQLRQPVAAMLPEEGAAGGAAGAPGEDD